jgi:hypothetical protein
MIPGSAWLSLAQRGRASTGFQSLLHRSVWPSIQSRGAASLPGVTSLKKRAATGKGVDAHAQVRDMTKFPPDRIRCVRVLAAFPSSNRVSPQKHIHHCAYRREHHGLWCLACTDGYTITLAWQIYTGGQTSRNDWNHHKRARRESSSIGQAQCRA